ncbi:MAG: hypothetical protein MUF06_17400, partial [Pirellulaceae bacterium]|nr:hypothetical protein [Pirellulaceae bacterium]
MKKGIDWRLAARKFSSDSPLWTGASVPIIPTRYASPIAAHGLRASLWSALSMKARGGARTIARRILRDESQAADLVLRR